MKNIQRKMFDYIWSDLHFGHKNIIKYGERPFSDIEEMEQALIDNYNSVVKPGDTCLFLGDCFFVGIKKAQEIMNKLNGKKILVRGNHDQNPSKMMRIGFDHVTEEMIVLIAGKRVKFCHFPYLPNFYKRMKTKLFDFKCDLRYSNRRPIKKKGEILVHGHTHSNIMINKKHNSVCVCVEAIDYKPLAYKDLEKIIQKW